MAHTDLTSYLVDIPLFKNLSEEEIQSVDAYMGLVEYQAGETVFNEGDAGEFVCFVIEGTLSVTKKAHSGEPAEIARLSKGKAIGEMALIDTLPRSATITADTAVTLSVLRSRDYKALRENHPHIAIKLLTHIARNLSLSLRRASGSLADTVNALSQHQ
jgi:CRP-like cAMP-binding protein